MGPARRRRRSFQVPSTRPCRAWRRYLHLASPANQEPATATGRMHVRNRDCRRWRSVALRTARAAIAPRADERSEYPWAPRDRRARRHCGQVVAPRPIILGACFMPIRAPRSSEGRHSQRALAPRRSTRDSARARATRFRMAKLLHKGAWRRACRVGACVDLAVSRCRPRRRKTWPLHHYCCELGHRVGPALSPAGWSFGVLLVKCVWRL